MQKPPIPLHNGVTVLESLSKDVVKTYQLDDKGAFQVVPYGMESRFKPKVQPVKGIQELGELVTRLSTRQDTILIRGQPKAHVLGHIKRNLENYQEPPDGLSWAMLDFDGIELPQGMSPDSIEAIEYVIAKLPEPFHGASYFYQFSSSTGVSRPDGTPLKRGLNVHLFFWFSRPITGRDLTAYLQQHCIETGFLERVINKGGLPVIRYGVDFSVFRPVQPHYIGVPVIKAGVTCALQNDMRQGLIQKISQSVDLPGVDPGLAWQVERKHQRILDEHKRASGWVKTKSMTKARGGGVGISEHYMNPNPAAIATGRELVEVKLKQKMLSDGRLIQFATLYFEDESSPGSWYVRSTNPTIAMRYGDYASIHLQELSSSAYAYVRDELGWFGDIFEQRLSLTDLGFLPEIASFATARNCLILAPTGSGKTTAFCGFANANRRKVIIYAAQTIALTRQMENDLRARKLQVVHYQDFNRYNLQPGVYVTTNESLSKIVDAVISSGLDYYLVIDEAHIALDDFMRNERKNRLFEQSISRAKRTLFMTATLTDIQLKKLTETVAVATGELTQQNFGHYHFQPVKKNPLLWVDMTNFWRDFVALLRHYQGLKAEGKAIPRTIIITPTSKMEPFRLLLEWYGLLDQAEVVSRKESVDEEVETARVGTQPILISSPLFALGLNFDVPPQIFWTYFKDIPVDESQIVQTLNRANRTNAPCEVRLYAGKLDDSPYKLPDEVMEKLRIEEYFQDESTLRGLLDSHYLIDRLTYLQLRDQGEKHTAKSLCRLKINDAIQNYTIVEEWDDWLNPTEEDEKIAFDARKEARERYDEAIIGVLEKYKDQPQGVLLYLLEKNEEARREFHRRERLEKHFIDKQIALSMALVETEDVRIGKRIDPLRIRRLFGDAIVFLSSQFDQERYDRWTEVAAGKTSELVELVFRLQKLKNRELDGVGFGWAMRTKMLRRAILASASNHSDYIGLGKQLDDLDKLMDEYKNKAGQKRRKQLDALAFKVGRDYLATLGIYFEKTKGTDGLTRFDPEKPVVPDWDFDGMAYRLLAKAESLKVMPSKDQQKEYQERWENGWIASESCINCRHSIPYYLCALGLPVTPPWGGDEMHLKPCDEYRELPKRLRLGKADEDEKPTKF